MWTIGACINHTTYKVLERLRMENRRMTHPRKPNSFTRIPTTVVVPGSTMHYFRSKARFQRVLEVRKFTEEAENRRSPVSGGHRMGE